MSAANAVTLGTLAAIRPHGQSLWTLGIVRRMRRLTTDRAELGLQVIANTLVGVDLVEQRKHADNDYSVDGEQTTINGRTFQGLFLALRKRETDVGVQSLIVPAVEFQPANRLKLMTAKSINPIRYGRLIEQQPDWVWATVEPLDLHHVDVRHDGRRTAAGDPGRQVAARQARATQRPRDAHGRRPLRQRCTPRTDGTCRRTSTSRRPAAAAGPQIARASRCTGKTSRAPRPRTRSGTCNAKPTGCPTRSRGWACSAATRSRSCCRSAAKPPSRTSRSTRWAPWPFRCRSCSGPKRSNTGSTIPRRRSRWSTRSRCRTWRPSATRLRATRARHRRGRCAWRRNHCRTSRWSRRRRRNSRPSITRAGDPALIVYTSGTTGPPKGALMPHACLLGNLSGFVHSHDGFPQDGDVFWSPADWAWTGGLMDALLPTLLLRPADRRLSRPLRSRTRAAADREIPGPQHVPVSDRAEADDEGVSQAARALRRQPAQHDERGRSGGHHGVRVDAGSAGRHDQRNVRSDRDELHRRQLAHAVAGEARLDGAALSRAPDRRDRRRRPSRARRASPARWRFIASRRTARRTRYSSSNISRTRKARARNTPATGAEPATSRRWMRTAISGTRGAPTTCSRSPAIASVRRRSRTASSSIRPWRMPPSSRRRTRRAATSSRRSSCSRRATGRRASLEEDIQQHVRKFLAPYEYPKDIEFIDALPMTTTGKVQRKLLREREAARVAGK